MGPSLNFVTNTDVHRCGEDVHLVGCCVRRVSAKFAEWKGVHKLIPELNVLKKRAEEIMPKCPGSDHHHFWPRVKMPHPSEHPNPH